MQLFKNYRYGWNTYVQKRTVKILIGIRIWGNDRIVLNVFVTAIQTESKI
jgi:hypothetical protein